MDPAKVEDPGGPDTENAQSFAKFLPNSYRKLPNRNLAEICELLWKSDICVIPSRERFH
jgi:hypothetical protein